MTRDAFSAATRRLALIAASTAFALAVAAVWAYLGWELAVAAVVGGIVVAVALTVEEQRPTVSEPDQAPLTRRQIEARREAAASAGFDAE